MDFINFGSKTFLLGLAMCAAGLFKAVGLDIPGVPDVEFVASLFPQDAGTLIQAGLAAIFIRHAVEKTAAK
jgi:hypothetical protein